VLASQYGVDTLSRTAVRKVRLLCIGRNRSGGGTTRVQNTLLEHLDPSVFEVTVFYLSRGESQLPAATGMKVEFGAPSHAALNRFLPRTLRRLCKLARRSDLVFGMQGGRPTHLAVITGQLCRRPVVGWVHNPPSSSAVDFPGSQAWAARLFYPRADRLVAVSNGVGRDLALSVPQSASKLAILPNPLDLDEVRRLSSALPPSYGERAFGRPTLMAIGGLVHRKGFDVLLRAFAAVLAQGFDRDLLILGEGLERSSLEKLVKALRLEDRVLMPGFDENPYAALSRAELLVLSSRSEGLPTVILEALSLGVPVVATDCPHGPRELLDGGRYGVIVPCDDHEALAAGITSIIGSPARTTELRRLGQERAAEFDAQTVARQFEALFAEVVNNYGQVQVVNR
jgi:glycosyltransferase involved in cell wall biosynthesis